MAGNANSKVRFTAVGTTDVGRIREHNEDNFLAVDLGADRRGAAGETLAGEVRTKGLSFVVADGMGGAAAGEVASQMAVDMLHAEFKSADLGGTVKAEAAVISVLEAAIHKANEAIFKKGQESKDHQGMGTTLTASVILGDSLYLSQVGDSRGYILRKGKLVQMTRDQSLIGQLIEEGTLTEEQAEKLGGKNIILQALGVEETLKIDSKRYDILRGDVLLLCSDGLSGMVPDPKMEEILNAEPDPAKAGKALVDAANAGGGKDNITCIVAKFDGEGLREPLSPLTSTEKAGGTFRAPEAPKSRAGRNAVVGTAVVIAAVATFLFWPRAKTLVLTVGPVEATVTVKGIGEKADAVPETTQASKPGEAVLFRVPKDMEVEVSAVAPGYEPEKKTVSTAVDQEQIQESLTMVRTPAKSLNLEPPNHRGKPLTGVRVLLTPQEGQIGPEQAILVQAGGPPEFDLPFPAGDWVARASRDGFEGAETPFASPSNEAKVVNLKEMTEIQGDLLVRDLPEGTTVTVHDGDEPLLETPATVLPSRTTPILKVRATTVWVKAEKKGHDFLPVKAEVKKGAQADASFGSQPARVSFQNATGPVRLRGPASVSFPPNPGGSTETKTVAPGTYRLTYQPADGPEVTRDFKVEPGQILLNSDPAK